MDTYCDFCGAAGLKMNGELRVVLRERYEASWGSCRIRWILRLVIRRGGPSVVEMAHYYEDECTSPTGPTFFPGWQRHKRKWSWSITPHWWQHDVRHALHRGLKEWDMYWSRQEASSAYWVRQHTVERLLECVAVSNSLCK